MRGVPMVELRNFPLFVSSEKLSAERSSGVSVSPNVP